METNITNSLTEIYAIGGGYLTEAYPTHFHTFCKRRWLLNSQSPKDFKEITESEKTQMEKNDAAFVRPPQSFIDLWNTAINQADGRYNEATGYFELLDLKDISYPEAIAIYECSINDFLSPTSFARVGLDYPRTVIPQYGDKFFYSTSLTKDTLILKFRGNAKLEVMSLGNPRDNRGFNYSGSMDRTFEACKNLRKIYHIQMQNVTNLNGTFKGCLALENIELSGLKLSIGLADSPNLSLASLQYMIDKAANTSAIIIRVHPQVYAKITDETNAEWHQLLFDATEKNINIATV